MIGTIAAFIIYFLYRYFAGNAGTVFEKDDLRLLAAKQQARHSQSDLGERCYWEFEGINC